MSRTVNLELSDYMSQVNSRMREVAGVGYMEVYKDVHGDTTAIRIAFESSVDVEDFVSKVVAASGFVTNESQPGEAREINLRSSALVAFSRNTPGWLPVLGGGVVSAPSADEIYVMVPSRAKGGGWGFETRRLLEGEVSEQDAQVVIPSDARYQSVGGGMDIKDALAAYANALGKDLSPDQGMRP